MRSLLTFFLILLPISCVIKERGYHYQPQTFSGIINKKVIWQNKVYIDKDILIDKEGEVLIREGTIIEIAKSDISRTEPIFLYPETEIVVKGKLIIEGSPKNPVLFQSAEEKKDLKDWGGIIIQGGILKGKNFILKNAYNAICVLNGQLDIDELTIEKSYIGLSLFEETTGTIKGVKVTDCQTGMIVDSNKTWIENALLADNSEGLLLRRPTEKLSRFTIKNNIYGLIVSGSALPFLLYENKIYENRDNLFIFDDVFNSK